MTKPTVDEIVAEPAGRRLDGWVHEYVRGLVVNWKAGHPFTDVVGLLGWTSVLPYSTDISAAWLINIQVSGRLFSVRRMFEHHLTTLPGRLGWTPSLTPDECVAWPAAMLVFAHRMPELICKAALLAG